MSLKSIFLSKFVTILPMEKSFFFQTDFKAKTKVTPELVALNYNRYSPYKSSHRVYLHSQSQLLIWFHKENISSKIVIPEVYLYFKLFKEKHPNTLIVIESKEVSKIILIKEGKLIGSYVTREIDEIQLEMERRNALLENSIKIEHEEAQQLFKEALSSLDYSDFYRWSNIKVDKEEILPNTIDLVAYPLSFLLLFSVGLNWYHTKTLKSELDEVETVYNEEKAKNSKTKALLLEKSEAYEKWKNFLQKELPYRDNVALLNALQKSLSHEKITIVRLNIVGSKLTLNIKSDHGFIGVLNRLTQMEGLSNLTIKNSSKKYKTATYKADILPLEAK